MKRILFSLVAITAVAGFVASSAPASGHADGEAAPIFGIKIPPGKVTVEGRPPRC